MARTSAKNIMKLIDIANNELPIEKQFLLDLTNSIEKNAENENYIPSKTYKPSSMNCPRQMVYQVLGILPTNTKLTYQFAGICESGSDRHVRIQQAIENMKNILNIDCEYIDVTEFVKQRNLIDLEIKGKDGMETKLYNRKYNISFMCDGIIKYKGKYYIFEFKTEIANKFYQRNAVDVSHYNQAKAYSLSFGIDRVLFIYENRDTLDKKAYIMEITDEMRTEIVNKIEYCNSYVKDLKIPPKPIDVSKKACSYCLYKEKCGKDNY